MANASDFRDEYNLDTHLNDGITDPATKIAASLDRMEAAGEGATKALEGTGAAAGAAGEGVSALTGQLKAQTDALALARAEAAAAAEANALFNGTLTAGSTAAAALAESTRAAAAAMSAQRAAGGSQAQVASPSIGAASQAGIDDATRRAADLEQQAQRTAAAVSAMGAAAGDTGARIVTASASWDRLAGRVDDVTRAANTLEAAQRRLDSANQSLAQRIASGNADLSQGARVLDALGGSADQAAQRLAGLATKAGLSKEDIADLRASLSTGAAAAFDQAFVSPAKNLDTLGASSKQVSFAMRQLEVQATQTISGLATGQSVFQVLVQQGHQVSDVMVAAGVGVKQLGAEVFAFAARLLSNPIVLTVAGVTAAVAGVVALGAAAESSARQLDNVQNALRATRSDYAGLATEVIAASKAIAASTSISTPDARAAGQTIAAAPNFSGSQAQLEALIKTAGDLAVVMGKTAPDAAKTLAAALQDPGKEAKALADAHFPGMTFALASVIQRMGDAGDTSGAFNRVLGVIQDTAGGAAQNLTPLQKATQDLSRAFTKTGQDGRSLADAMGSAISTAAATAVGWFTRLINGVEDLRQAAATPPEAANDGNRRVLGQGPTLSDVRRRRVQAGLDPAPGRSVYSPDDFSNPSEVDTATNARLNTLAKINDTVGVAAARVAGSPAGQIQQLGDEITRFKQTLADLGPKTAENATQFNKLTEAIKADQKSLSDAQKTLEGTLDPYTKLTEKLKDQVAGQQALAAAWEKGPEAVARVTAAMQAQEQVLSAGLKPGTDKYNQAVATTTDLLLKNAQATDQAKIAQDTFKNGQQIQYVQAEIATLGQDNDQRALMLQHIQAEITLRNAGVDAVTKEGQAYLASVDQLNMLNQAYQHAQSGLQALSDAFSQSFDTIGNAMAQAFVQGQGAAVNWGNVMKSVVQQVIQQFLKLAVVNPLLNSLFGGSRETLGSVINALAFAGSGGGSSISSAGSASAGAVGGIADIGGGFTNAGGFVDSGAWDLGGAGIPPSVALANGEASGGAGFGSILSTGSSLLSIGRAFFPDAFSSGGSFLSGLTDSIGLTGTNGALTGLTSFLNTPIFGAGSVADAEALTLAPGYLSSGGLAPGLSGGATIGGVLGAAGAGFGVGSLAGGFVQRALGKTGPGPEIGAALGTAVGIGSVLLAPETFGTSLLLGAVIGGGLGGIGGGSIGNRLPTKFGMGKL